MSSPTTVDEQRPNQSERRSKQRSRCRELLSDHLRSQLGIDIPPAEVRMRPRKEDGYRWSVLPQKEYLFEKNLSKLSTGMYTQIIQGIGVFFEALPKEHSTVEANNEPSTIENSGEPHHSQSPCTQARKLINVEVPEANFMAHITQLQHEVTSLQAQVCQWQSSAQKESSQRAKLEADLKKAKSIFIHLRRESTELRKECQKAKKQSSQLKVKADAWDQDVRQLVTITHRLAAVSGTQPFVVPSEGFASVEGPASEDALDI
ncbi:hypothetical protein ACLMJK_004887 [Lecanora helva]